MTSNILKRYYFFHPLTWYVIGYCIWMLIPPLFDEQGYNSWALISDLIGSLFLFLGFLIGSIFKILLLKNVKIRIREKKIILIVISCILFIFSVRFLVYQKVGIYAFLHQYSRESSLIDTFAGILNMPYILLLVSLIYLYGLKGKIYIFLFLIECIIFIIPTLSRTYLLLPVIFLFFSDIYYGKWDLTVKIRQYISPIITVVILLGIIGPYMQGVRSYAYIGEYEKGLDIDFQIEDEKFKFLLERLNIHRETFNFEPYIQEVAALDSEAIISMTKIFLGVSKDYSIHPTSVSNEVGKWVGYSSRTSTDIPRNFVLINYEYGILILIIFNFLQGFSLIIFYKIIFDSRNFIFLPLWFLFIWGQMFSGQGAMPSGFIFQNILNILSCILLAGIFSLLSVARINKLRFSKIKFYPNAKYVEK
jgi:hypothetical protein